MGSVLTLVPSEIDIAHLYDDLTFPAGSGKRPYIAFNMVSTIDGKVTIRGRSYPVGSKVDHSLMRKIRAAADMVLIGAGTLRIENVDFRLPADIQALRVARGLSPVPLAAVLSQSADLPLDRTFFSSGEFTSIVFTVRKADPIKVRELEKRARVIYVGDALVDLAQMMSTLVVELGVKRLVVEGGPRLNASLMKAGYGDDLFWTVAPRIVGGHERTMVETSDHLAAQLGSLRLASAYSYRGELFLRYLF